MKATETQTGANFVVGSEDFSSLAVFEGLDKYGVGIIIVNDEDVVISTVRAFWETAGEIRGDETGDVVGRCDGGVDLRGSDIGTVGSGGVVGSGVVRSECCGGGLRFGGTKIPTLLLDVGLDGDFGFGQMLANQSGSEAGPGTVVSVVNGNGPGRWDGATGRGMQEANEVFLVRLVVCAGGRMECFVCWWKGSLIGEWDAP